MTGSVVINCQIVSSLLENQEGFIFNSTLDY